MEVAKWTCVTHENHRYHEDAPPYHREEHYHVDGPAYEHKRYKVGEPIPHIY